MDERQSYQSDLTDEQWAVIEALLPVKGTKKGRPRKYSHREMFNAMLYVIRTGCTWRDLPHDFPKWQAVYAYMRRLEENGSFKRINDALRERERVGQGRNPFPSTVVVDTQSVRTAEKGAVYGYDGNKHIKGRKRVIAVDTLGLLIAVYMAPANLSEQDCLKRVLYRVPYHNGWQRVVVDGGFAGAPLEHYCRELYTIELQVVKRSDEADVPPLQNRRKRVKPAIRPAHSFVPLRCRWVVERTFAWFGRYRRLVRDYEMLTRVSEALIYLASIRLLVRRLA